MEALSLPLGAQPITHPPACQAALADLGDVENETDNAKCPKDQAAKAQCWPVKCGCSTDSSVSAGASGGGAMGGA